MNARRAPRFAIVRTTLVGGLAVLLPISILVFFFRWLYSAVTEMIRPLTNLMVEWSGLGPWLADFVVIALILAFCFLTGLIVRTRVGGYFMRLVEERLFHSLPGYKLVKETVGQFVGNDKPSPFSKVALVHLFGDAVSTTAFVTAEHDNGMVTVFVPTGPNPTSGLMFHVPRERVVVVEGVSADTAMRTVIGCGVGAQGILKAAQQGKG